MRAPHFAVSVAVVAGALALTGCPEEIVVQPPLGGSCLGCHNGITDIHPAFALSCVDCHGGDDQVALPGALDIRDQEVLRASHVLPKEPEKWWANGVDDNDNGQVDEEGEFFSPSRVINVINGVQVEVPDQTLELEIDSEINRDINYLRFINPGDLRAAEVSCGSRNNNAIGNAMTCHAEVVYDVRRSIMSANAGVPGGALYGNGQRPRAADYGAAFAASAAGQRFDDRALKIGRAGYAFDWEGVDGAFDKESNSFDPALLADRAAGDCDADATVNCDQADVGFEAWAGPVFDDGGAVDFFDNELDRGPGFTRTGNPLKFPDRSVEVLQYIGNRTNRQFPPPGTSIELRLQRILGVAPGTPLTNALGDGEPITNPVDAALRNFRAYHVLNFVSPSDNFPNGGFVVPEGDVDPNLRVRNNNNPFGRFGSTGCSACHVEYGRDGKNREPVDRTVADNGRQPSLDLPQGINVLRGERAWPRLHQIRTAVQIETCASCHGFVTRVDYALEGKYELETDFTNFEGVQTLATTFTTPNGTEVEMFDNLAEFIGGAVLNAGERVSEDRNNNGELDAGEDADGDGRLDIPDRIERSKSFDGRQSKFVYGGPNGSTRLLDIHFEVGMACSDCHVTSVHGDSNIYTRNWDAEPLECDDCHGTPLTRAPLVTSGPNGGDKMDDPIWNTPFDKPWFEERDGQIIEHSRTKPGLFWVVPQLADEVSGNAETGAGFYAHRQPLESPAFAGEERALAHIAEPGQKGGLECYSCHSTWQPNCLTCHLKMDVAKPRQEIWFGDDDVEDIFFQLFSYTRSPFYLGRAGDVEGNKIAPYRSTMQVHLSVVAGATTLLESAMLSSEEGLSSIASNPYFPHTVRATETKSCARCHTLEDAEGRVANDHLITEATAQGTGRYMNIGDFAFAGTDAGLEIVDVKRERREQDGAGGIVVLQGVTFPGFDFEDAAPRNADFAGSGAASDVAIVRGVSFVNGSSDFADVAIVAHAAGASIVDVTGRDNAGLPPTALGEVALGEAVVSVDVVDSAASQTHRFVALTATQLCTVDFGEALEGTNVSDVLNGGAPAGIVPVACLAHSRTGPSKVRLHGRYALVGHDAGVAVFELGDGPTAVDLGEPLAEVGAAATATPVLDLASSGRFVYAAAGAGGVVVFDAGTIFYPLYAERDPGTLLTPSIDEVATMDANVLGVAAADARGVAIQGSRLLVAGGVNGLHVVDIAVPADPILERTILDIANGNPLNEANAVVVAAVPMRNYAVVADGSHGIRVVNLTPNVDFRTRLAAVAADPNGAGNRGFRLSNERADPLTPFDPRNVALDEAAVFPDANVFTFATDAPARALARGLSFDGIADKSGRQLRDSWSIGATSLDEELVARMRSVIVNEADPTDRRGDGLGCIVRKGDDPGADPANACVPVLP